MLVRFAANLSHSDCADVQLRMSLENRYSEPWNSIHSGNICRTQQNGHGAHLKCNSILWYFKIPGNFRVEEFDWYERQHVIHRSVYLPWAQTDFNPTIDMSVKYEIAIFFPLPLARYEWNYGTMEMQHTNFISVFKQFWYGILLNVNWDLPLWNSNATKACNTAALLQYTWLNHTLHYLEQRGSKIPGHISSVGIISC